MNKITQKVLIILTLVVLLPATCMAFVLEQGTWRYKMTVTVETPDGLKFVLVVFTEKHAGESGIIPAVAGEVIKGLSQVEKKNDRENDSLR